VDLKDKLRGRMTGSHQEQERCEQLVTALVEALKRGGEEAACEQLREKMNQLGNRFGACLVALGKKL
jgi:hypothetical protein